MLAALGRSRFWVMWPRQAPHPYDSKTASELDEENKPRFCFPRDGAFFDGASQLWVRAKPGLDANQCARWAMDLHGRFSRREQTRGSRRRIRGTVPSDTACSRRPVSRNASGPAATTRNQTASRRPLGRSTKPSRKTSRRPHRGKCACRRLPAGCSTSFYTNRCPRLLVVPCCRRPSE